MAVRKKGERGIREIKVNGRRVWQARVAYKGERKSRLCATWEDARNAKADLLHDLQAAAGQAEQEGAKPPTLRVLCELYVTDLEERGKDTERAAATAQALETAAPDLLDRSVMAVTLADLYAFRTTRTKGTPNPEADPKKPETRWVVKPVKVGTVNRDLVTLRAMLKKARPDFKVPSEIFYPEDETRVRWLRPEDELLVFELLPAGIRGIARLASLTLMRESEILRLRRADVHLEQGVILLPRAKKGPRPVILSQAARDLLQAQLDSHGDSLVFPAPQGGPYLRNHVSRRWRKAARAACLRTSAFTICGTTGPPWPSTPGSPPLS